MKRPFLIAASLAPFAPLLADEAPTFSQSAKPASAITFLDRGASLSTKRALPTLLISAPDERKTVSTVRLEAISKVEKTASKPQTVSSSPVFSARNVVDNSTAPSLAKPRVATSVQGKPTLNFATPKMESRLVAARLQPVAKPREATPDALSPVSSVAPLPDKVEGRPIQLAAIPRSKPAVLASRKATQQRMLLAALDADLAKAENRLRRSETRLSEGQRQLGSINNLLRNALLDTSEDARGLHPFVRVSQRYLGTPYVWGGESARGFDCSGFIMRVMRDLGYKALPHSAAAQFNYGTPISKALLKPGDIVFFANTYKRGVSHVGIYLGRGRFIHAANSQQGTIVSGINEPKWVKHYAGARRLVRVS